MYTGKAYPTREAEPKPREVCTIYEIDATSQRNWRQAVYNFRWTPQTDPFGVVHKTIDYPGVPVDDATVQENHGIIKNIRIPIKPHFGVMGVAPKEADYVDSKRLAPGRRRKSTRSPQSISHSRMPSLRCARS
jgi:acetamidase/formamidase